MTTEQLFICASTEGLNWLLCDSTGQDLEASHPGLPVLHTGSKVSIYSLKANALMLLMDNALF
ncbi:MAG: hypothetical protein H7Z12_12195 [Rhodospirillaceae bacterium]|nr:hypothetical protein [Rhodospirillales bacterium]